MPVPTNLRRPNTNEPFRYKRSMGEPTCLFEYLAQNGRLLIPYNTIVLTIVLILLLKGR